MSVSTTEGEKCHVIQVTKEAGYINKLRRRLNFRI